jgi:hypothetical protein
MASRMRRDQSSYCAIRGIDKRMGDERILSCFWQPKLEHHTPTRIDIHCGAPLGVDAQAFTLGRKRKCFSGFSPVCGLTAGRVP